MVAIPFHGGSVQKDGLISVSPQRSLSALRKNSKVSVGSVAKPKKLDTLFIVKRADDKRPNQFSRETWDANAEHWDARMGDEGNDFFKTHERPSLAACALSDVWETRTQQEELPNAREIGCSLIIYFRFA